MGFQLIVCADLSCIRTAHTIYYLVIDPEFVGVQICSIIIVALSALQNNVIIVLDVELTSEYSLFVTLIRGCILVRTVHLHVSNAKACETRCILIT